jgi:hypothetical protein
VSEARGYPRPQLARRAWTPLNGQWEFALDADAVWSHPQQVAWRDAITVPFAPETPASGIHQTGFFRASWYRRRIVHPAPEPGYRVHLHFGAVDYAATVWIDGHRAAHHEGGYTPFTIDLTDFLGGAAPSIVVRVEDDPHDLTQPRGKQDWLREPHSIWYPRTSGIWQTVWLETVHSSHIGRLRWTPNLERWELGLELHVDGPIRDDLRLDVRLHVGTMLLADDSYAVIGGDVARRIALSDPGIDDYRNELLWSPRSPTLIDAVLTLRERQGKILDEVRSYTALRSVALQAQTILLNGRPEYLRMVLDQGYWPDTGMTAPSDAALRRDVVLAKQMGFNGVRKHQKIEDPRYLYWADRLGLLVWEEMPSAYRFTSETVQRLTREWLDAVRRDSSHPCIVAWVPFNESWGVPDLPDIAAQRHFVQGLYCLTRTLDPTRPVIGNDGWESVATDIVGIHDYEDDPARLARRYEAEEVIPHLFKRERPAGRLLTLDGVEHQGQPIMLSEFGGIAFDAKGSDDGWGYSRAETADVFIERYRALLAVVGSLSMLAGFCYTQFSDTYQEKNGLLDADRTPKVPLEEIRAATRGPRTARQEEIAREWQERMLMFHRERGLATPDDLPSDT